jgi:glucuronate isomerase
LCDLFGDEIENGELPNDVNWTGKVIQDICFYNAQNYFDWKERLKSSTTKKVTA